jgi:Predicted outer membrane protein
MEKRLAATLCSMLLLCAALPITAFADDVHIATAYQPFMYFEKYNDGYWSDLGTPPHSVVETGQPAYCLQMSLESPYGDGYDATDGTQYYTPTILNGLKAILAHGYPASNGGFNDNQAQYATANAIRYFLAENGIQEMPYYLRDTGNSRPKPGYEALFAWCLELLEYGRHPDTFHSISFSNSDMTLESQDTSFVGDVRVSFTGLTGGYTLDTSAFPAGTSITGYTGSNGDTLHISVPEEYEESVFPLRASGVYDSTEAVLFFYAPTTYGQQRVVTCTIDMQSTTVDSGMTVRTPKAPIRTGTIRLTKVDENGAPLPGVCFALYDSGKNEIQNGQTDANGAVSFEVPIGDYFYAETATLPYLVLDSTLYPVSVTEGGQLVSTTAVNEFARGNLKIVKRDAYEDTPLAGAGFRLYDSDDQQIAEGYTDANGELTFERLLHGSYSYQEFAPPKGYELGDTVYPFSITEHGVTVTQERDNLRRPGTLEVKKQDHNGAPLSEASFLLEYSTDNGASWTVVFSREGDNVQPGGCTSPRLADGQLTTGESGYVTFSGLRADSSILYRLTETKAPDGHSLLGSPLYVGTLPVEIKGAAEDTETVGDVTYCYTLYITATDDPTFRIPETGGAGFAWLPLVMGFMTMPYIILKRKDEIET